MRSCCKSGDFSAPHPASLALQILKIALLLLSSRSQRADLLFVRAPGRSYKFCGLRSLDFMALFSLFAPAPLSKITPLLLRSCSQRADFLFELSRALIQVTLVRFRSLDFVALFSLSALTPLLQHCVKTS
ncbi:hypothetical protein U1Q18_050304 [Sarracenia purpurea var. burkii]